MIISGAIIQFMQKCIQHESAIQTWGLNQIQVSDNKVTFHVSGYNYCGKITVKTVSNGTKLELNSAAKYIGTAKTAIDAIKLLDTYIESNEDSYRNLLDSLIK